MRELRTISDVLGDLYLELQQHAQAEPHDGRADMLTALAMCVAGSHNQALDLADDADRRARRLATVQAASHQAYAHA